MVMYPFGICGGLRIATAPMGPRNDRFAATFFSCHSEEERSDDVGIRNTRQSRLAMTEFVFLHSTTYWP